MWGDARWGEAVQADGKETRLDWCQNHPLHYRWQQLGTFLATSVEGRRRRVKQTGAARQQESGTLDPEAREEKGDRQQLARPVCIASNSAWPNPANNDSSKEKKKQIEAKETELGSSQHKPETLMLRPDLTRPFSLYYGSFNLETREVVFNP